MATLTNTARNTATLANTARNTATLANVAASLTLSLLLLESGSYILLENGDNIILDPSILYGASMTNVAKN